MADEPKKTVFFKPIPPQVINEGASFGPLSLRDFVEASVDFSTVTFQAALSDDQPLPKGLICTGDGIITGIPPVDTAGNYTVNVTAKMKDAQPEITTFILTIKQSLLATIDDQESPLWELKTQVWEALEKGLPLPDLSGLAQLPVTSADVYYLLERWAVMTIYDAFNLESMGPKNALTLEGASPHYHIYDCGTCLVGAPKDLFSHERTLEDGLMTARAMAREVYQRKWTIEFTGFDKMVRAAWIELQILADKHGKSLDILYFKPKEEDVKLYALKSSSQEAPQSAG